MTGIFWDNRRLSRLAIWMMGAAMITTTAARAEVLSGNDLYYLCTQPGDALSGFCAGYVMGTWDGMIFAGAMGYYLGAEQPTSADEATNFAYSLLNACPATGSDYVQTRDVVVAFLRDHPERRHETARGLLLDAMKEAFPCD